MSTITYVPNGSLFQSLPAGNTIRMQCINNGPDFPITAQPVDLKYGPLTFTIAGGGAFPGGDPAVGWGSNVNFQIPTEPQFLDNMEVDFSPSSGHFQAERYIQFNTLDNTGFCRPVSATYNRLTKTTSTGLSYKNGTGVGTVAIAGVEGGQQVAIVDNGIQVTPNPYSIVANAVGWTIGGNWSLNVTGTIVESATSTVQITAGVNWNLVASGANGTSLMSGDAIALANHASTNLAFVDNVNSPGNCRIYPNGDNIGSIGTNANRWALIRGVTITSGDLDLHDPEHGSHWTVREEKDAIVAFNQINGRWYKLAMIELTDGEIAEYHGARPMRKGALELPSSGTVQPVSAHPLPEKPKPLPKPDRWEFWRHPYDRAPGTIGHRVRPGKPS